MTAEPLPDLSKSYWCAKEQPQKDAVTMFSVFEAAIADGKISEILELETGIRSTTLEVFDKVKTFYL